MVGRKQQLKRFQDLTLKIEEDELSRESSYKYLGIIINENMTWGDHIASMQQKVAKRIGLIKRIGHLIPRAQLLTLVNTMIIPLFDYGDTVSPNLMVDKFHEIFDGLLNTHAPIRRKKVRNQPAPWITPEIKRLMEERDRAKKNSIKNPKLLNSYKSLRNKVTNSIRFSRRLHYQSIN